MRTPSTVAVDTILTHITEPFDAGTFRPSTLVVPYSSRCIAGQKDFKEYMELMTMRAASRHHLAAKVFYPAHEIVFFNDQFAETDRIPLGNGGMLFTGAHVTFLPLKSGGGDELVQMYDAQKDFVRWAREYYANVPVEGAVSGPVDVGDLLAALKNLEKEGATVFDPIALMQQLSVKENRQN